MQRKVKGTTRAWWKIHPWPKEPCVYLHQQPGRVQRSVLGIRLSPSKPECSLRAKRYSGKLVNLGLLTLRQTIFFDLNTTPSNLNHEFYSKYPRHTQTVQTVMRCFAAQLWVPGLQNLARSPWLALPIIFQGQESTAVTCKTVCEVLQRERENMHI